MMAIEKVVHLQIDSFDNCMPVPEYTISINFEFTTLPNYALYPAYNI